MIVPLRFIALAAGWCSQQEAMPKNLERGINGRVTSRTRVHVAQNYATLINIARMEVTRNRQLPSDLPREFNKGPALAGIIVTLTQNETRIGNRARKECSSTLPNDVDRPKSRDQIKPNDWSRRQPSTMPVASAICSIPAQPIAC